jgi:hypothetical protein
MFRVLYFLIHFLRGDELLTRTRKISDTNILVFLCGAT